MPPRKAQAIPAELLDQLLADEDAATALGERGLLDSLKKALAERALNAEMDHHLGDRAQSAFVESFNGRMHDEFLNESLCFGLTHARTALAGRIVDYNARRPRSAIGCLALPAYAVSLTATGRPAEPADGSARRPVAQPSPSGAQHAESLIVAG